MPKNNSRNRREVRRTEAEQRQAAWNALTIDQRIERVTDRIGQPTGTDRGELEMLLEMKEAAV